MANRFTNCKNFRDLYNVFCENPVNYDALLQDELDRIAIVFEANIPANIDMPDVPLTEAGYKYIWDVVVDTIDANDKEECVMNNTNVNQSKLDQATEDILRKMMEDDSMSKDIKVKVTVNNAINNIKNAKSSAKVHLGDDKEAFVNRCDDAINDIKNNINPILTIIDDALGLSVLKERICSIMYDTLDGTKSKNGFFKMAEECRKATENMIKSIAIADPDDKLGKVAALRYIIGEDAEGNKIIGTQSIWEAFAKSIVWICKKIHRKLTKWFSVNEEENIFGAVGASIAGVFATVGNIAKNIAKVVGTLITFVGSYIVAGVIKITQIVVTAFKWVVSKIKGWIEAAKDKLDQSDIDDDLEEDEDLSCQEADVIA